MTSVPTWDRKPLSGPAVGLRQVRPEAKLDGVEACTSEGCRHFVPLAQLPAFLRAHAQDGGPLLVASNSIDLFAEIIHVAEQACNTDLRWAAWALLRANRVLDLGMADDLLRLARGERGRRDRSASAKPDLCDLVRQGGDVCQQLHEAAGHHRVPGNLTQTFGPLGQGLQVGCAVALKLAEKRKLRFRANPRASSLRDNRDGDAESLEYLQADVDACRNKEFHRIRSDIELGKWVKKERKNGYPHYVEKEYENWRKGTVKEIIDGQLVILDWLVDEADRVGARVEFWPPWALQAANAASWRRLHRLCHLSCQLECAVQDYTATPSFSVLPSLRWDCLDLSAVGAGKAFACMFPPRDRHVLRIGFPRLALAVLAWHLVQAHGVTGPIHAALRQLVSRSTDASQEPSHSVRDYDEEQAFVLLAGAGLGPPGISNLARSEYGLELSEARQRALHADWSDALRDHLADTAAAGLERELGVSPGELRRRFPELTTRDVEAAVCKPQAITEPGAARELRDYMAELGRSGRRPWFPPYLPSWEWFGLGREAYRKMTDERGVLPSGVVHGRLLWIAARFAESFGAADEVLKSVIFMLAAFGIEVLGFENEAVFVLADESTERAAQKLVEPVLEQFCGDMAGPCSFRRITG